MVQLEPRVHDGLTVEERGGRDVGDAHEIGGEGVRVPDQEDEPRGLVGERDANACGPVGVLGVAEDVGAGERGVRRRQRDDGVGVGGREDAVAVGLAAVEGAVGVGFDVAGDGAGGETAAAAAADAEAADEHGEDVQVREAARLVEAAVEEDERLVVADR